MSEFYSIVTNIGTAKIANAEVTNQKLDIVHYAVGDGGGNYYNPTVDQTALRNERWRGTAIVDIDPREPNVILITTSIPHDVGGFDVREIGIFDANGDMVIVGKVAEFYKPVLAEGSTLDGALKTRLIVSNTATVALKNDPNLIHATKYYVDTEIVKISESLGSLRDNFNSHLAQHFELVVTETNIPVESRKSGSFYLIVTDSAPTPSSQNITVSPTMGLKKVEE